MSSQFDVFYVSLMSDVTGRGQGHFQGECHFQGQGHFEVKGQVQDVIFLLAQSGPYFAKYTEKGPVKHKSATPRGGGTPMVNRRGG